MKLLLSLVLLMGLALGGCATTPDPIRKSPDDNPTLRAVRANPEAYQGRELRWGGSIVAVENRAEQTCIEVVERVLESGGRPVEEDRSQGRFLACVPGFLDPVVYEDGRLLTVRGTVVGVETRKVGEYPYRYPVVAVSSHHLWEPLSDLRYYEPDPFWYYPWPAYGPYPWRGYPYYPYYRYR